MLRRWLAHPLTRGRDIDAPATTGLRRRILREKRFLRQLYSDWYRDLLEALPPLDGPVLELGSGAGFLAEHLPGVITSELFHLPGVSLVLDAHRLPFHRARLRAIVMVDVFHHLAEPRRFLAEASRCVRPGGALVLIEPWVTSWSRLIYSRLHHEPFQPEAPDWSFPSSGPLSGANGALPWIVFERDRTRFEAEFPELRIRSIDLGMPVRYLLSGGVSLRSLVPGAAYRPVRWLEGLLRPWMGRLAMFARIVLDRCP
jgi:SAM-dependent methyltransferase